VSLVRLPAEDQRPGHGSQWSRKHRVIALAGIPHIGVSGWPLEHLGHNHGDKPGQGLGEKGQEGFE
jgi:hypothetical protein